MLNLDYLLNKHVFTMSTIFISSTRVVSCTVDVASILFVHFENPMIFQWRLDWILEEIEAHKSHRSPGGDRQRAQDQISTVSSETSEGKMSGVE